jgi:hypothetical protein
MIQLSRNIFYPLYYNILGTIHTSKGMQEQCFYGELGDITVVYRLYMDPEADMAESPHCLVVIGFFNQKTRCYHVSEFAYYTEYCLEQYDALMNWFEKMADDLIWFATESAKDPTERLEETLDLFIVDLDQQDLDYCESLTIES